MVKLSLIVQAVKNDLWLERHLKRIKSTDAPSALDAAPEWGTAFVIHALSGGERPLVWLKLENDNPIDLGNELAAALKRATGRPLIKPSIGYSEALALLERYGDTLGPYIFAVSGAAQAPDFVRSLYEALGNTHKLILTGAGSGELLKDADVLTQEALMVTAEEALALAGNAIPDILERSGGIYEQLMMLATSTKSLRRPKPSRYYFAPEYEPGTDADALIDILVSKQQFSEALDVAASERPERVSAILSRAGSFFAERNLYAKVWDALSRLTPEQRADEVTLFALLDAANHSGSVQQVQVEVETFLEKNDAPDLRALHALLCLSFAEGLAEVETAYKFQATAFTSFGLGRTLGESAGNTTRAEKLFRESLQLAEARGNTFATVRAAWALSMQLMFRGSYHESVYWSHWGLSLYKSKEMNSPRLHLFLANIAVYTKILIGEVEGLAKYLKWQESKLANGDEVTARLLRTTLGDLLLALGEPQTALSYYETTSQGAVRENLEEDVPNASRCLAELGKFEEGLVLAKQTYYLAKGTRSIGPTALAVARLLAKKNPKDALPLAEEAFEHAYGVGKAPQLAQAGAWLARIRFSLGDIAGAREALERSDSSRAELSGAGLHLLECENLPNLDLISPPESGLHLRLLGQQQIYFEGEELELTARQLELLTLLTLNPSGLNVAELQLHLFGEGTHKSLKAVLSRLLKLVPILSRPYRLNTEVDADFIKVRELVEAGYVDQAVRLYKGPLLPESESPYIREESDLLEEQLITAALASRDPEILYPICQTEGDRLDLWEALLEVLPQNDPRYPACAARVTSIQRTWDIQDL